MPVVKEKALRFFLLIKAFGLKAKLPDKISHVTFKPYEALLKLRMPGDMPTLGFAEEILSEESFCPLQCWHSSDESSSPEGGVKSKRLGYI